MCILFFSLFILSSAALLQPRIFTLTFNESLPLISPPLVHYRTQIELHNDLKLFMGFAYAASCNDLVQTEHSEKSWRRFPPGNDLEENHPTTLVKTFYDPQTTISAYICFNEYKRIIVVGFRPTITLTLWKLNLKLWKSRPPITFLNLSQGLSSFKLPSDIYTHHGFNENYQVFRADLMSILYALATSLPSDYKIVFTGHSLGAALAEMAAVDFTLNTRSDANITNRIWSFPFASPRVGNKNWAHLVNSLPFVTNGQSIRMVRLGDPTSQLPFSWLGYVHTFREIVLKGNGELVPCPNDPFDPLSGDCTAAYMWLGNPGLHLGYKYVDYLGTQFICQR